MKCITALWIIVAGIYATPASAGEVEIVNANAVMQDDNTYVFHVTLRHEDEGWEHYARKWEVVTNEGDLLGERILFHPHVNEQPFTRSLSNVRIPNGVEMVLIRAYDSEHGVSSRGFVVKLSGNKPVP